MKHHFFTFFLFVFFTLTGCDDTPKNHEVKPAVLTLDDVDFDESTGTIQNYKANFTEIIIPDKFGDVAVQTIATRAFVNKALTTVIIPNSVTTIGADAFSDNALTHVIIPNSVTTLGSFSFAKNALVSVTISNAVTALEEGTFFKNALTDVIIPESVTRLDNFVFLKMR